MVRWQIHVFIDADDSVSSPDDLVTVSLSECVSSFSGRLRLVILLVRIVLADTIYGVWMSNGLISYNSTNQPTIIPDSTYPSILCGMVYYEQDYVGNSVDDPM